MLGGELIKLIVVLFLDLNFWETCVVPRPFWEQDYFIGFLTKLHAGVGLEATRCS